MSRKLLASVVLITAALSQDWTQFRGPNASGLSNATGIPVVFGPDTNVVWRTPLPPGHSSPVIGRDRIYLTAVEQERLFTFAVDRATGRILWRREAPRPRKQVIERPANGPVSASPVTDGRNVFVFFQDFGLLAYGPDGHELWRMPMGPFNNPFGHGASPILARAKLLMNVDQDTGSFLIAIDKDTGKILWRTERPHAQRGYSTPVIYAPKQEVVVAGSYRVSGYDLETGKEVWTIRGLPWQIKPTPIIAGDVLYFITFSGESDPGAQEDVPPFTDALATLDRNKDGKLSKSELVDPRMIERFDEYLDLDHTGFLEERDWEHFRERRRGENGLRAYRLGGKGDITTSHLLWKNSKSLPNVPSPLFYRDLLYTLKEGGIFASIDPQTGEFLKQARLQGALGTYYASPAAADGNIYLLSEDGKAVVIKAGAQWEILRVNQFEEAFTASPAILDGRLYLRTSHALYCFAKK